jgi:hypothetical protein
MRDKDRRELLAWMAKMDMQQAITAKRTSELPTKLTPIGAVDRLGALGRQVYKAAAKAVRLGA